MPERPCWRVSETSRLGARQGAVPGRDLCDQAARIVEGAGAVNDDKARQRLVASSRHEGHVIAFGTIPGMAEDNAEELAETLREIDEDSTDEN